MGNKIDFGALAAAVALCASFALQAPASAGFSHKMPAATNEKPSNPPYGEMLETFRDPSGKVQTGCYWYWLSGNVSCDGVRKDLEAMKKAGIDRAYIGDIAAKIPQGPVKTFSPEWKAALAEAFETANRLGIEIGLFNSPGWSQSGGPWVKPEQAMRRFVASSVAVKGPARGVIIPAPVFEHAPAEHARDVALVAYPLPAGSRARLEVRDADDFLLQREGRPLVVELVSPEPFKAQSVELAFCDGEVEGTVKVEAEAPDGGGWKTLCEMPFSRRNHAHNVTFAPHAPVVAAFASAVSRKFRVTVVPSDAKRKSRFSSVAVCAAPHLSRACEKSLARMFGSPLPMWGEYLWPDDPPEEPGTALDPAGAMPLRGRSAADDALECDVPAGEWLVFRFAAAPTGTKNGPAAREATGYEIDKTSRKHVAAHFDAYLGKILDGAPQDARRAVRHAVLDSYEQGGQNFADGFAERFRASFGYDPSPYLPAVFGEAVGSRDASNRFLWDLRRFIADEVAYSYVGGLREASNARGLQTWLECYGHWGFPAEFLQYGGQSDAIGGEFWSSGSLGDIENRAASSCGHIYGKRLVWAESNTSGGPAFGRSPADLKGRTDRFFAEGVNATILHFYAHQPDERQPGVNAWFGNEFNRHNTWFRQLDLFIGYLKRAGYLLRQGLYVADVAYFIGEDAPKMTGLASPPPPPGRQFDYINGEVLRETASVDASGRITLPHGTAYEVLVLPELETMRPEMLAAVERLVMDGAFVLGPKPSRSPSLAGWPGADATVREMASSLWGGVDGVKTKFRRVGKGTIAQGLTLEEALAMRASPTDCVFDKSLPVAFCHRTMPGADIYFVANQSGGDIDASISFRDAAGRVPELWHPATGEVREAPEWRIARRSSGGRVPVKARLALAPWESVFVVFAKKPCGERRASLPMPAVSVSALDAPWTLSFESDAFHRGPAEPVVLKELSDLSKHGDPAVRHYAGTVVYRTHFRAAKAKPGERAVLSFGKVREIGRVKVNGRAAGGIWTAPYEVPVTELLRDGENDLEVEVCTGWPNRLIGDAALPEAERPTWLAANAWKADSPLRPAGLEGPVRLIVETPQAPASAAATAAAAASVAPVASPQPEQPVVCAQPGALASPAPAPDGDGPLVGMFYFLWLGEHGRRGPYDISKILAADPGAPHKPESPAWGPWGAFHHWGEPLFGYYFSDDEWVMRRHLKLLMQAGVDFIFFDVTNSFIYEKNAKLAMRILKEYRDAGRKIPKAMFYTNSASGKTARRIYDAIYAKGYAKETWFMLNGKPAIVAKDEECDAETKAFFTILRPQWPNEKARKGGWPWMDFSRPQRLFEAGAEGRRAMNVSVAQHPQLRFGDSAMYGEKGNRGRAFHGGANDPAPDAWTKGGNFAEQWERAISAKPDVVLVTGWNEWTAQRLHGGKNRQDRPVMFVDCASPEYSRDIEMMRGGYGDAYYLQLCECIRRFKASAGGEAAFSSVAPNLPGVAKRYPCFADDSMPRVHPGFGTNFVNRTQRNAPEWIDVRHDGETVFFEVKTRAAVSGAGEGVFMRIEVDGRDACALGRREIAGERMTLAVPRNVLGLDVGGEFRFVFKFVDSPLPAASPLDLYDTGVTEPAGRAVFEYRGL